MIGNLTNDMIRLCSDIASLRESRAGLRRDLAQGKDDLKETVAGLRAHFRSTHDEMARNSRDQLCDFVGKVKDTVACISHNVATFRAALLNDIAGARQAWSGSVSSPNPGRVLPEEQARGFTPKAKKKKR